jgi:hypothetical protein
MTRIMMMMMWTPHSSYSYVVVVVEIAVTSGAMFL